LIAGDLFEACVDAFEGLDHLPENPQDKYPEHSDEGKNYKGNCQCCDLEAKVYP
jgi:hypothetical protein